MKVLVVADRPTIREFLAGQIHDGLHAEVCCSPDARACFDAVESWDPEIAVLDLGLPEREIRRLCVDLGVASVQTVVAVADADEGLRMLGAGVTGISSAVDGVDGIVRAVDSVAGHHTHVPPALLGGVLHGLIERRREQGDNLRTLDRLSSRESEVLALLGEGCDQRDVARRLGITPQTAKTHIRHVLHKLGVSSQVEAAALASEIGAPKEWRA